MSFQLVGLDAEPFATLFSLTEEALRQHGAVRRIAETQPGYPCRISLEDAAVGDELLLLPFTHQPALSPYRASGPIYVRRGVTQKIGAVGEVPCYVTDRLISVRSYDPAHMMIDAAVCEGAMVAEQIAAFFNDPRADYLHLHNAKRGCFSCRVNRA
ncbi:DUF1203 domain-containing protein [Ottowia testudinis]|uniref:DUF1203 domain-containing protein n=1 Tax=Ottowia testudinis TaxID=2816950 RepID=A0A975CHR3_9BURK|nr:DUF1203 domain-containing protein [Ottowia testudinis]QTD46658.1 DUF1203 domain-containing protein [Ottowia testudinis]